MADFSVYNNIQRTFPQPESAAKSGAAAAGGGGFGNFLKDAIDQVNNLEKTSNGELEKFLDEKTDLHSVMIALEKADLSFQTMMQVRNKIVSAYQEIMRSQV
jgi:flagellar hook-basal body complex protein FliE